MMLCVRLYHDVVWHGMAQYIMVQYTISYHVMSVFVVVWPHISLVYNALSPWCIVSTQLYNKYINIIIVISSYVVV